MHRRRRLDPHRAPCPVAAFTLRGGIPAARRRERTWRRDRLDRRRALPLVVQTGVLSLGLALAWMLVGPRTADLAAQTYRVWLFAQDSPLLWDNSDNSWYGGRLQPRLPPSRGASGHSPGSSMFERSRTQVGAGHVGRPSSPSAWRIAGAQNSGSPATAGGSKAAKVQAVDPTGPKDRTDGKVDPAGKGDKTDGKVDPPARATRSIRPARATRPTARARRPMAPRRPASPAPRWPATPRPTGPTRAGSTTVSRYSRRRR